MDNNSILAACVEARLHVYRLVLSCLEDDQKNHLLVTAGSTLFYPFVCSPKVSVAIADLLVSKTDYLKKVQEDKQRISSTNSWLKAFIENMLYDIQSMPKFHATVTQKTEAVAEAMCIDLEIDMATLRGNPEQIAQSAQPNA